MTVIVTGERGVGKTTAIATWANADDDAAGILSVARFSPVSGAKSGIDARDIASGETWRLAAIAPGSGELRIGPYLFDAAGMERAVRTLHACAKRESGPDRRHVTVVDEIGPLELNRKSGFWPAMPALFASESVLLVTVRPALIEQFCNVATRCGRSECRIIHLHHGWGKKERGTLADALSVSRTPGCESQEPNGSSPPGSS